MRDAILDHEKKEKLLVKAEMIMLKWILGAGLKDKVRKMALGQPWGYKKSLKKSQRS